MLKSGVSKGRGVKQGVKTKRKGKKLIKKGAPAAKKLKPTDEALSKKVSAKLAEEISSDSDSGVSEDKKFDDISSDEHETAQERRLKLAKKYLSQIEAEHDDDESVAQRLQQDNLEKFGQLHKKVADECQFEEGVSDVKVLRGHKLAVTCLVISNDDKFAFSGSKDGSLIKWSLTSSTRLKVLPGGPKNNPTVKGHSFCVTAVALSTDFKYFASGDTSKLIRIWNPADLAVIHSFTSHRDGITGLSFRLNTHQLFSSSADRSVKIWNLDEMGYVESLFGHQDTITALDSLLRDRALTSGGRDNTVRLWKIPEESQLVFQGNGSSIDCISLINEQHFVSASDNGSISLWGIQKKKPLFTVWSAHKKGEENCWISSLSALANTDVFASGSRDGIVRVWKCREGFKGFDLKTEIPVVGFVNALKFSKTGSFLLAAVGQEHRCGRWWRIKEAKNSIVVIPLRLNS